MDIAYKSVLDYLHGQLPMFQRQGAAAYKSDLSRTEHLLEAVGNPQKKFKSVHVAGTNGKGSVTSALAAIFTHCGYKTGLYTSPHLFDFRERIRVEGRKVDKDFVVDFVNRVRGATDVLPSFFEITTAMAFSWFAKQKVDIAVVETGLGGRLDSTNVILPELSVITSISFDHQAFLGNSLTEIAREKGGIIKPGRPVVIGENPVDVQNVLVAIARDRNSEASTVTATSPGLDTDLGGDYQAENMRIVRSAVEVMRSLGWSLPEEGVIAGAKRVLELSGIRGRWEVVSRSPLVVADAAHNEAGIRRTVAMIGKERYDRLHVVWGMVSDKDSTSILSLLPASARYYWAKPDVPRGKPAEDMEAEGRAAGLTGSVHSSVRAALAAARAAAAPNDMIYIGGSLFVLAEALNPGPLAD